MSFLTREAIIAAQDRKFVEVDVPEWGGTVRLRSLDAEQALHQETVIAKRQKGDAKANPLASMLSASIVDGAGAPLFTEKDMHELGKKNPGVLIRLVKAANDLNQLGADTSGDDFPGGSEGTTAAA